MAFGRDAHGVVVEQCGSGVLTRPVRAPCLVELDLEFVRALYLEQAAAQIAA